jgi:serine phosphatase RsbU (regulator of sigma subunit)
MTQDLIENLTTLNEIAETLNRSVQVKETLDAALGRLVELMGLETGWIFLKDPSRQSRFAGQGYELIAYHNLPPAMELSEHDVWTGNCDCQALCNTAKLSEAYNEVRCSRLARAGGDKRGLRIHASVPLRSGDQVLGILNVAAPEWPAFSLRTLTLLTNVGHLMGIALERARLYDLLQERRIHEQGVMLSLSNYLLNLPELKDLMDYLLTEIQRLLNLDACALLLPNVAKGRLEFRAAKGWKTDPVRRRWLSMDEPSGPVRVMEMQEPLVKEDMDLGDPHPWQSDWVKAEGFQGHAVVPLIADGRSIGALMVNCRGPRRWEEGEIRLLQLLANQAALALERTRMYQEDQKRQELEEELSVSQRIQHSMLPRSLPKLPGWQFAAVYRSAKQVGGDFYDFITLPVGPHNLGIVVADVADKGVPAALYMALSRTIIRSVTMSGRTPAEALLRANEIMLNDSQADIFLTAFYATLDSQIGEMSFCNAGHNPPLWYRADYHEIVPITTKGIVLGILDEIALNEQTIYIARDDVVMFYTDGVTEALNMGNEEFGVERLRGVLMGTCTSPAQVIVDEVEAAIREFTGNMPQFDDFTLVVLKRDFV